MMKMCSFAELVARTKSSQGCRKELDAASGTSTTLHLQSPCSEIFSGPYVKCLGRLFEGREGCLKVSPTRVVGSLPLSISLG